jgi:hypothetical protein
MYRCQIIKLEIGDINNEKTEFVLPFQIVDFNALFAKGYKSSMWRIENKTQKVTALIFCCLTFGQSVNGNDRLGD